MRGSGKAVSSVCLGSRGTSTLDLLPAMLSAHDNEILNAADSAKPNQRMSLQAQLKYALMTLLLPPP